MIGLGECGSDRDDNFVKGGLYKIEIVESPQRCVALSSPNGGSSATSLVA